MDNSIPGNDRKVERVLRTQQAAFHARQEGNGAEGGPKRQRIEVPDEESREAVEVLLQLQPLKIAGILLNRDDRLRDYVHYLPEAARRAIVQALPIAANRIEIKRLQEQALVQEPLDHAIRTIIGTAKSIEARVRGIIERRLTEEAKKNASQKPGNREWLA